MFFKAIENLIDRIVTSHPSAKIVRSDPGFSVELSGEKILMEAAPAGCWQVSHVDNSQTLSSITEDTYVISDLLNKIYADTEAKRPKRGSSASYSSSSGGGDDDADAVSDTWTTPDSDDDD